MVKEHGHHVLEKRRRANVSGLWAERYAEAYLRFCGYKILQRRYKTPLGEIDLIAKKADMLVLIEVKMRANLEAALQAVTPQAQKRIGKAGQLFLSRNPALAQLGMRYDVIAISRWRLKHMQDVWRDT